MYKKIKDKYSELSGWSKKLLILVGVVLLAAFFAAGKGSLREKGSGLETIQVRRQDISTTVSASGAIEGEQQATLHFQSPGKVSWVGVTKGEEVNKGQVLAKLDTVQLNASLQIARSNLRAAETTLERVYDDVKDHDDDETFTQKETRTTAEVAKDKAYDAVLSAQKALTNSTLIAPFDGVVVSISDNIIPGANIALTDTLVIADTSRFKFVAQVDEVDYGKITLGQKAEISLDAFSDEIFEGIVSYIGKAGVKTAGGGVTIPIEIQFDSNGNNMAVGLSGDVEFIVEEKENVLVIPKRYLSYKDGNSVVYIFENGNQEEKIVTTGLTTLTEIEIIEGLSEDQEVILPKKE